MVKAVVALELSCGFLLVESESGSVRRRWLEVLQFLECVVALRLRVKLDVGGPGRCAFVVRALVDGVNELVRCVRVVGAEEVFDVLLALEWREGVVEADENH